MKVLFCTNDQSFQPSNEPYGFYLGITSLGHSAEVFYYRRKSFFYSNFRKPWVRWMNNHLAEKCIGEEIDLLLVHRGGYVAAETLERIRRESGCRTACFFPDNPFGAYTPPLPFDLIAAYDHQGHLFRRGIRDLRVRERRRPPSRLRPLGVRSPLH
jgi:hypothetical protein